jgi:hypothetical protein
MKGNNGNGNNETRDDWETPGWLFDKLTEQYNFKLDCCANEMNKKCEEFFKDLSELKITNVNSWMNPPFSKAKEMFKMFFEKVLFGVAIYRSDNLETKIWQEIIFQNADWIFILNKRVSYEHNQRKQKSPRFASVLIGKGLEPPKELEGVLIKIR